MTRERVAYSRVYWSIVDDERFAGIYERVDHLGAWVTLLLVADQAYPASAHIPRHIPARCIRALSESGLIEPLSAGRYRVHGLDAERRRRARGGLDGDQKGTNRSEVGYTAKTSLDETRQDEGQPSPRVPETEDPADAYWSLTGRYPNAKALAWIDQMTGTYGASDVIRVLAVEFSRDKSTQTLLGRVNDQLRANARKLDLAEKRAEEERIREARLNKPEMPVWNEADRAALWEKYRDDIRKAAHARGEAA